MLLRSGKRIRRSRTRKRVGSKKGTSRRRSVSRSRSNTMLLRSGTRVKRRSTSRKRSVPKSKIRRQSMSKSRSQSKSRSRSKSASEQMDIEDTLREWMGTSKLQSRSRSRSLSRSRSKPSPIPSVPIMTAASNFRWTAIKADRWSIMKWQDPQDEIDFIMDVLSHYEDAFTPWFYERMTDKYRSRTFDDSWSSCSYYSYALRLRVGLESSFYHAIARVVCTDEEHFIDCLSTYINERSIPNFRVYPYVNHVPVKNVSIGNLVRRQVLKMFETMRLRCPEPTNWRSLQSEFYRGGWDTIFSETQRWDLDRTRWAVVLFTPEYQYVGHVYTWASGYNMTIGGYGVMMQSIRISMLEWVLQRCKSPHLHRHLAYAIMGSVSQWVKMNNYQRLFIPGAFGAMPTLLERCGFVKTEEDIFHHRAHLDWIQCPTDVRVEYVDTGCPLFSI